MALFFSKEKLSEIRNRANIVDVISEYVTFKRVGKNYQALCPFHSEKTPSFNVNEEKQIFYCFGCQKGGDVITFLREINNISFVEAVSQLAARYGISLPPPSYRKEEKDEHEVFLEINERVANYYHQVLTIKPEGEIGRRYLKKRGIEPRVWETFKLGYAVDSWYGLVKFLSQEKIPLGLTKKLGLLSSKKEGEFFDCFRGRIIFPIFNLNGKTIGFGGRDITGGTPKYLNSSDSVIYKKSFSVFGLPITRSFIGKEDRVLVVEGYFDLLSLFQSGICSVVSPLGTALTSNHIQTLKRLTSNFYLIFDADEAGDKAALRSLEMFLNEGISPRVVILPAGSDPDDFVRQKGANGFRERIENAPLLIEYYIEKTFERKDISHPEGKVEALKEIMPVINQIGQPIIQDEYIRRISEKLGVREDRIRTFGKYRTGSQQKNFSSPIEEKRPEEYLLTLMLQKPEIIPVVEKAEAMEDMENPFLKKIVEVTTEMFRKEGRLEILNLVDQLEEKPRNLVTQLSFKKENFGNIFESIKDCICQIKRNKIKKMKAQLTQKIKKAQEGQDEDEIRALNKQKIQLILQEKNLNKNIGALLNFCI